MARRTCVSGHLIEVTARAWLVALATGCASGTAPASGEAPATRAVEVRAEARAPQPAPLAGHFVVRGAEVVGVGVVDVEVRDGVIAAIGTGGPGLPVVAATGRWIVPAAIDSHVHLSYLPAGRRLLRAGVAAVVDLAAPLEALQERDAPPELTVLRSGPMITARGGYPTRDWGADGFGLEVDGAKAAGQAVDTLADAGARVIKVPVTDPPVLGAAALRAIVARAHARGLKVVAHALLDGHARAAAEAGADVLAHSPVEPLQEATVKAWAGRAVIGTLSAFGGAAPANLRRLRAAGATVLYGTDLGNTQLIGISGEEIELLQEAGLDGTAILEAMTAAPAKFWGLLDEGGPGVLRVGGPASFLILRGDPRMTPLALAEPEAVFVGGRRQDSAGNG